ncbi:MAG: Crp/Fnr family transcriptional regulator [Acetobacteraceae bacterium]|nr:Crp/Fnr family transcriptional regulator [Acetobacteraceae bacterium]
MGGDRGREHGTQQAERLDGGLARLAFLRDADPAALAAAAPAARWLAVGPGELVLDFGDTTDDVFFVAEGAVRVVVRTPLGQEVILGDLGPGDVFGEMAAIDGAPRSANVAALHASRLCRLPAPAFLEIALRSPAVGLRVMRVLTTRLRLQDERLFEQVVLPVRYRIASELLRLSHPRDGRGGAERVVSPPPPQHVLAARVGTRRETVSLMLTELSREGLVEATPRAIVLPRPEALRAAISAQLRGLGGEDPVRSGQHKP